jgi:hypothetical protein
VPRGLNFISKNDLAVKGNSYVGYLSKFYRSLLSLGFDGFYSWSVICAPYIAYDVYLLIKSYRTQKMRENEEIKMQCK